MADAGTSRQKNDLRHRVSRINKKEMARRFVPYAVWKDLFFAAFHPLGSGRMRSVLRSVWSYRPPGPDHNPDAPKPDYFFFVAYGLLSYLPPSMETPGLLIGPVVAIAFLVLLPFLSEKGEKLAPAADRCFDGSADRHNPGNTHPPRWVYAVESGT